MKIVFTIAASLACISIAVVLVLVVLRGWLVWKLVDSISRHILAAKAARPVRIRPESDWMVEDADGRDVCDMRDLMAYAGLGEMTEMIADRVVRRVNGVDWC